VLRLPGANLLGIASKGIDLADSVGGDSDWQESIDPNSGGAMLICQRLHDTCEPRE
jgi:hypothetical protein